jgi:hypothetical protein
MSAPPKPHPCEAQEGTEELDPVFDPDELCRKLERYKFAQEECAKRRQRRLLDDEQRRKKRQEQKLRESELGSQRQHQLDKLIPAVRSTPNSSSTNLATPRFIAIDPIVRKKKEEDQWRRGIERKQAEEAQLKREAERRRQEYPRKQKQDLQPRKEEESKLKREERNLKQQTATAHRFQSGGQPKVARVVSSQNLLQAGQECRRSHLPPAGKVLETERKNGSAPATAIPRTVEEVAYRHIPQNAKSDFQRTATADPLRKKNIHRLALPIFDQTTKRTSLYDHSREENGRSWSSDHRFDSPLSPPLDWLQLGDKSISFNGRDSLHMSESDTDSELTYQYKPTDRPDWTQTDQIRTGASRSWGSKTPSSSSNQAVFDTTTGKSKPPNLSNRKSLLGLKSIFGR